ncbi:MAG: oligosaccharide flippase family protein [Lachnospiraceae bacterium]|nr:oligosaccharide flippase family protein [Lachnospiraceae bacterium]
MGNGHKKTIKSIISVSISNIATVVAGIIIGFVIPKVTEVEGYGFYKTFTLYVAYAGMFSIGIIDGIVLEYGGVDYTDYDRPFFRSIFKWYLLIHSFWVLILVAISFIFHDVNYSFIVVMVAIYMFFGNMVGYFQQISQITQRFKEYSRAKMIQSFMKILGGLIMVAIFFLTNKLVDYRLYVVLSTLGFVFVTIGYLIIYRQIVFGESESLSSTKKYILNFIKIGFPLLIANLCSTLILTLDRQFVNLLFPNSEYAVYAFAYNMLSLVTVATSAISTVLYPILKRTTPETLKKNYSDLVSIMLVFVFGALLAYFPLCKFIGWFLPKYNYSLPIFRVIFPGLAISSAVHVIMHNYYKTLGKNIIYFKKSIVTLLFSAVANAIAYLLFRSTISISIASIVTMIIWYLYIEQYFVKNYGYKRWKNFIYTLSMMTSFYLITIIDNWIMAGLLYLITYITISFILERKVLSFAKQLR